MSESIRIYMHHLLSFVLCFSIIKHLLNGYHFSIIKHFTGRMAGEKTQYCLYSKYAHHLKQKTENLTLKAKATKAKLNN